MKGTNTEAYTLQERYDMLFAECQQARKQIKATIRRAEASEAIERGMAGELAALRAEKGEAHKALGALYSAIVTYYVNMARRIPAGELDPISECRVITEHQHAKIVAAMDAAQRFALDHMHAQNAARAALESEARE